MKFIIYDIETLRSVFTFYAIDHQTGREKVYVLHESRNDLEDLFKFFDFCKEKSYYLVGYNNLNFDWQVCQWMIENKEYLLGTTTKKALKAIYKRAMLLINTDKGELMKAKELFWESNFSVRQIDLFIQKNYNNKARVSSLKWIEFTMRFYSVQEMPIDVEAPVGAEDIALVVEYNRNDVLATRRFFELIKYETDVRVDLEKIYDINFISDSESTIAKKLFSKFLCEEMGIDEKRLKSLRTERYTIEVKDILFDINFKTPKLQEVYETMKSWVIYPALDSEESLGIELQLGGIPIDIKLGGIHGCAESNIYESNSDRVIKSADVASYYPNLAIQYNLRPEHLGEVFNRVYKGIYTERRKYPKKDPRNYVFKILLNKVFGQAKEATSKTNYLYDPQFLYTITLNGQLSLLRLAEELLTIPDSSLIMLNTDGLEMYVPRQYEEMYKQICDKWQEETKLTLEFVDYKKMVIRDVNNYLSIDDKNETKEKGCFEILGLSNGNKDFYHKNGSFQIIPKALYEHYVKGKDFREFIRNHRDIYDFCGGIKQKKDFELNLYTLKDGKYHREAQQKVCRYIASLQGGKLYKDYHTGKRVTCESTTTVRVLNTITDEDAHHYPLNYGFYTEEVQSIINAVHNNQLSLLL